MFIYIFKNKLFPTEHRTMILNFPITSELFTVMKGYGWNCHTIADKTLIPLNREDVK